MAERKFILELRCENAAFDGDDERIEVADILRKAADFVEDGFTRHTLMDVNGNTVGGLQFEGKREEE